MITKTEQGLLQGREGVDYDGNKYFSFQGIPYAKPPLGELRFKAPEPPAPWSNVRDATKEASISLSKNFMTKALEGSEDCLYLNVFSNNIPSKALQPVMVWVHGGGFLCGSGNSDIFNPEYLLTQNVVVVTFNYRLGILGFLGFEDKSLEVPGNAGLKDMVMALKWVQKNISQFGGDPNNVTVFGHSAGSAAVNFLMLSPTAKGLFHRTILLSGTVTSFWAVGVKCAHQIASALGCSSSNEREILEFLRKQDAEKIVKVQDILKDELVPAKPRFYSPSIETPNPTAFITERPLDLLKSGNFIKVPVMLGYTSEESIFFEFFQEIVSSHKFTNLEETIPYDWGIKMGSKASKLMANEIRKHYFGDKDPSANECIQNQYTLTSDVAITKDVYLVMKLLKTSAPSQPVYLYRFSADTKLNCFKELVKSTVSGVSHGDELPYIFKTSLNPDIPPGSIEDRCIRRMVKLFTNFAKTSNPTPVEDDELINWEPVHNKEAPNCLEIGNELKSLNVIPENDRLKFWETLKEMKF